MSKSASQRDPASQLTTGSAVELDRATKHARFVADRSTTDNRTDNETGWAIQTNTLNAQTRALRSMAAFLEHLDVAGHPVHAFTRLNHHELSCIDEQELTS